ncbi:MAG: hypothetical protein ACE5OV_03335 [Candidatus Bathyarchaeia archaeon]
MSCTTDNTELNQHDIPRKPAMRHNFGPILNDTSATTMVRGNNIAVKSRPNPTLEKACIHSEVASFTGGPRPIHPYISKRLIEKVQINWTENIGRRAEKKNTTVPIKTKICHTFNTVHLNELDNLLGNVNLLKFFQKLNAPALSSGLTFLECTWNHLYVR